MFFLMQFSEEAPGYKPAATSKKTINNPGILIQEITPFLDSLEQETVFAISLNNAHQIINTRIISVGLVNETVIHPREVFRGAIIDNAISIIIGHNHPSGILTPSNKDIEITKKIMTASELIGIRLLDHVITGNGNILSMKGEGYL